MDKQTTCTVCDSTWPVHTTIDAYKNYMKINMFHPKKTCDEAMAEGGKND